MIRLLSFIATLAFSLPALAQGTLPPTMGTASWCWNTATSLWSACLLTPAVIATSITYAASTASTVSTSATIVAAPGSKSTNICNATAAGGGTLWVELSGGTAVSGQGIPVAPGGGCLTLGPLTNANGNIIKGVSSSGTVSYTVTLGS